MPHSARTKSKRSSHPDGRGDCGIDGASASPRNSQQTRTRRADGLGRIAAIAYIVTLSDRLCQVERAPSRLMGGLRAQLFAVPAAHNCLICGAASRSLVTEIAATRSVWQLRRPFPVLLDRHVMPGRAQMGSQVFAGDVVQAGQTGRLCAFENNR
jgi:hypothetical protein